MAATTGFPGEDDVGAEEVLEELADEAVTAEEIEQEEAGGDGRHDEREGDEGFDEGFAGPGLAGQKPGEGDAEGADDERAERGGAEGEADEWEVIGGHGLDWGKHSFADKCVPKCNLGTRGGGSKVRAFKRPAGTQAGTGVTRQ